jgi:serine/threonine protein kinase
LAAVSAGCLDESTVLGFLGGTLAPDRRNDVEEHLGACSACTDLVTWTGAEHATISRLPGDEGRPFIGALQPGTRVGRYQILGALGRGGMGEVYAAYHPDLDRRIAVKVVLGTEERTADRRDRLLREARAVARLAHPNVVSVYDAGTFGDGVFIAMELIDGPTVEKWLGMEPRSWRAILDVFMGAARGLAAAHAAGVIHRDFKPQNAMIAKDGSARVMDFGLARLAHETAADGAGPGGGAGPPGPGTQTVSRAVIGTPAYMSPEQARRETADARSDQFSFCVALHEALFGSRPAVASAETRASGHDAATRPLPTGVPGSLRAIVLRGASSERERRYPSMEELLAALERGRTRFKRRVSLAAAALATTAAIVGAWRIAEGRRFDCAVPKDRLAAAWSPDDTTNPMRQAISRALAASGRPTAQTTLARVSKVLDDYANAWAAMYQQACGATHLRGEQSAEVLDLRMSCLNENLDQLRALTLTLAGADADALSHAVAAAHNLTPISRCADVALLRSAVPLPRDEKTLQEVQRLRRSLAEVEALRSLGRVPDALAKAVALRPAAEATGYKGVLAETLSAIGQLQVEFAPNQAEQPLEEAVLTAESAGDDETAARAMTALSYAVGLSLGRSRDGLRWASLAHAVLNHLNHDRPRLRAWLFENEALIDWTDGRFETGPALMQRSIDLLTAALGSNHPDTGLAFVDLSYLLIVLHRPAEALAAAERAVRILRENGDPNGYYLVNATYNRGEALRQLGRRAEARAAFEEALRVGTLNGEAVSPCLGDPLTGLGELALDEGNPTGAIPPLERALTVRPPGSGSDVFIADTKFALARALGATETDRDRHRAHTLASEAHDVYATHHHVERQRATETWLRDR